MNLALAAAEKSTKDVVGLSEVLGDYSMCAGHFSNAPRYDTCAVIIGQKQKTYLTVLKKHICM